MASTKKARIDEEPILEFSQAASHIREAGDEPASLRTCIVSRTSKEKTHLLRFAVSPQDEVVADLKGSLPGRGVWVSARKSAVAEAVRRKAFQRAFKRAVSVPSGLEAHVEDLLKRSALQRLSLATKAGLVVKGFSKVEEAIVKREIVALLHAVEAAADGRCKLDRKFEALSRDKDHIPVKNCFTSSEISLATGSANVIHAGLKEGGATRAFLQALDRLIDYCTEAAEKPPRQGKE